MQSAKLFVNGRSQAVAPAESVPRAAIGHQQQALHGQQRRRNRGLAAATRRSRS